MNKRQKSVVTSFVTVMIITAVTIVGMLSLRDWVNRAEATRAMEHLGRIVVRYRQQHGCAPPESYIDRIKSNLRGHVRIGQLCYRALWISFESPPDEILAYCRKNFSAPFVSGGYLVLRLDGSVEWMDEASFQKTLTPQQSLMEIQMQEN